MIDNILIKSTNERTVEETKLLYKEIKEKGREALRIRRQELLEIQPE